MVLVVERKGLSITLLKAMLKRIYPKKTEKVIITSLVTERVAIVNLMVQINLQIKNLPIKISQRAEKNKTFFNLNKYFFKNYITSLFFFLFLLILFEIIYLLFN